MNTVPGLRTKSIVPRLGCHFPPPPAPQRCLICLSMRLCALLQCLAKVLGAPRERWSATATNLDGTARGAGSMRKNSLMLVHFLLRGTSCACYRFQSYEVLSEFHLWCAVRQRSVAVQPIIGFPMRGKRATTPRYRLHL